MLIRILFQIMNMITVFPSIKDISFSKSHSNFDWQNFEKILKNKQNSVKPSKHRLDSQDLFHVYIYV